MLIANRRQQSQQIIYFNTSHVNVNPDVMKLAAVTRGHFNTSHVNVNRIMALIMKWCSHISIHLMLMLILNAITYNSNYRNFNTSHVNVNPTNLSLFQSCLNLSLPILSHFTKNYQPIYLYLTMELITLHLQVFTWFLENFFINHLVNIFII